MRIAAFDLGSNSFHMIVVETRPDGGFVPIAKEREMLRLGDLVARRGELGHDARDRALEVLRRFKSVADAHDTAQVVAVGTSALREAKDGPMLVASVRRRLGVSIHIIDGIEEARTIFTAIRASVVLDPAPALAIDLGGGSLELMLGDATGLQHAASAKLGVGRLTTMFLSDDPPSDDGIERARAHVRKELAPILDGIASFAPRLLVGSSGTFIAIARIAATLRDGTTPEHLNHLAVSDRDIRCAAARVVGVKASARLKVPGVDARRADLLPAGFLVLEHVMERLGFHSFTVSGWALREGLVLRTIAAHDRTELSDDPRSIRRSSVLSLCHRSNWNREHAVAVADLAMRLFDECTELHGLGERERELLEFGALMHDIGEHISKTNHDRHSAYLVANGNLRGFTPGEVRLLSLLVRHHLRGSEKAIKADAGLGGRDKDVLVRLVAILRVADALDASHRREIRELHAHVGHDSVDLALRARDDAELELWSFRRKRALFERVFGVACRASVERRDAPALTELESGASGLG